MEMTDQEKALEYDRMKARVDGALAALELTEKYFERVARAQVVQRVSRQCKPKRDTTDKILSILTFGVW